MSDRAAFLAGERPDDVLMYFAESAVSGVDALADLGERVEDGAVLVVDGERGRGAFESATGLDPMAFARDAMGTEGSVDPDCTGGTCPASDDASSGAGDAAGGTGDVKGGAGDAAGGVDDAGGDANTSDAGEPHDARFVFAFAEAQNEDAGGLYAEGDVIHAYVACTCGETYADKWVAGER